MRQPVMPSQTPESAGKSHRRDLRVRRPVTMVKVALTAVAGLVAAALTLPPASASAAGGPYQRGPAPTLASVAASRGPFATSQLSVGSGHGFKNATIYYPTDTSLGTWGAVAIVPGYTAKFSKEEAWMGPWLASFGFAVIGIDTNSPNDFDTARGTQLLAALDYLTQKSPVRDRVDPGPLGVIGHSMGGGGVVWATEHRPSLKAAVALAPFSPSQNMSTDKVPTMVMGGQRGPHRHTVLPQRPVRHHACLDHERLRADRRGRSPLLHASQQQRDARRDPLAEDLPGRQHPLHPVPLPETGRPQGHLDLPQQVPLHATTRCVVGRHHRWDVEESLTTRRTTGG